MANNIGCGTVALGLLVAMIAMPILFDGGNDNSATPKPKLSDAECRKSLQCWGDRHRIDATFACEKPVEQMAKYSHEWTDKWSEAKFGYFRWKDQDKGVITYIGDKIRFQNGFGAMQNYVYECDFDPVNNAVLAVRASPGRISR